MLRGLLPMMQQFSTRLSPTMLLIPLTPAFIAPATSLAGDSDGPIESKSDPLTFIKRACTGLTAGSNGLRLGVVAVLFCFLVTGVSITLSSAGDVDFASGLRKNLLRPRAPGSDRTRVRQGSASRI
jgi:hypothetical protein